MQKVANKSLTRCLQEGIVKLIQDLNLTADDKIPTEYELAKQFKVSRASIREALANLNQEGHVYKVQGKGTFLRAKINTLENGIDTLFSITEAIINSGFTPCTSNISIEIIEVCEDLAVKLNIPYASPCYKIKRIRKANDIIAVYNINVFPVTVLGKNLTEYDVSNSIFEYLEKSGCIISHAKSIISPTILTNRDIPDLGTQTKSFLLFEEIYYNTKGEAVGYTNDFYNSDVFKFNIIRKRSALQ